uniref:Uncharacterized protein n=1 Tax=Oryza glumipatula TaxID=40148 RepID=A0A0E0AMM8_9ORYZ
MTVLSMNNTWGAQLSSFTGISGGFGLASLYSPAPAVSCVYDCCWVTKVGGFMRKFLWMSKDVKSQYMWNGGAFWFLQESRLQGSDPILIMFDASTVNAVLADLFSSVYTLTKSPPVTHEEEDDLGGTYLLFPWHCSFIGDDFLINTIGPAGKEKADEERRRRSGKPPKIVRHRHPLDLST